MRARTSAPVVLHVAEPAPGYLGRPPIVVDCSVLSAALFQEAAREDAIEFHRPDIESQFALSLRYSIAPYDAAYLWLAGVLKAPLATFDAKLAKAARAHLAGA